MPQIHQPKPRLFETRNFVIDLETLALSPHAVVTAAALAQFGPPSFGPPRHIKTWVLDVASQQRDGRVCDAETCLWWMMQPDAARASIAGEAAVAQRVHPYKFLLELVEILAPPTPVAPGLERVLEPAPMLDFTLWAKPQHFDITILEDLARQYKVPGRDKVIHRRKVHNVRTAFEIVNVLRAEDAPRMDEAPAPEGEEHNPTHDVMRTAQAMSDVLAELMVVRGWALLNG